MYARVVTAALLAVVGVTTAMMPLAGAQTPESNDQRRHHRRHGGALPGVAVTAIHGPTGQRHGATTNAEGFYALRSLPIGP